MSRRILFFILIVAGSCQLFDLRTISKAGDEAITKYLRSIPFNTNTALSADTIRGDANGDGQINGGDVLYLALYMIRGGPPPPTLENGDANGDGLIDFGDVVYLIHYLFRHGSPPPL